MQTRLLSAALAATLSLLVSFPSTPAPGAPGAADDALASLAWLAGHWQSDDEGGAGELLEELWMPPRGRVMLGLNRSTPPGEGRAVFEYLRIEARDEGVFYVASPGGGRSTDFRLVEGDDSSAVFANPKHDFPKRITYRRTGDELVAHVEGDGEQRFELRWRRVGDIR